MCSQNRRDKLLVPLSVTKMDDASGPQVGASPRFDRWTLRDLNGKVKRTFEVQGYNWATGWTSGNTWEDYIYRDGTLLGGYPNNAQRRTMSVDHLGTPRLHSDRLPRLRPLRPGGDGLLPGLCDPSLRAHEVHRSRARPREPVI